ncbi:hypothetical protein D5086_003780 [Populus alba]|uniref:Uncharacterized protein n=1 Tax=Populus alba TaxID=43335 RepID=A0ACC4D6H9_POPAL
MRIPFFAFKSNPKQVSLDFVLFQPNQGVVDPKSNFHYDNMLFAQIDAVYSALASLGYSKVPVHISETGWPSKGDEDEPGPTSERNYGLFKPDGSPAYLLGINGTDAISTNSTPTTAATTTTTPAPRSPESTSTGYLSISAAVKSVNSLISILLLSFLAGKMEQLHRPATVSIAVVELLGL